MTQHLHSEVVPGCFRCDLGLDEYRDALLEQIRDAASDWREAEELLSESETAARALGISEEEIGEAKGLWLR